MDSGTEAACKSRLSCTSSHMATGGGCCMRSIAAAAAAGGLPRTRRVGRKRLRIYEGNEAPLLWADVPADILGTVLRLLPCLADRASVRSVCRHWRAAARVQAALPAPLPVLVLPRFGFSCLTSDGLLTCARRALMPVEVAGDMVVVVGSSDDWLMVMRLRSTALTADGECFLVHAFSGEVVHLPRLQQSPCNYHWLDGSGSARPTIPRFTKEQEPWLILVSAGLSASPSSGSDYIVATLSSNRDGPGLALWKPGMTSWYFCRSTRINSLGYDLAFYQGKLYMVWRWKPDILAFELRENEHGVSLSCAEHYNINRLISSKTSDSKRCNLVVWRGKLLLIIRFLTMDCKLPQSVEVFALDFGTNPCGVTQIHTFDGDCIFVQKSSCRSFSTGSHDGVQGDLIYFLDERIINHVSYTYVHNMRDGTLGRISAGLPLPNSGSVVPKESCLDFPVWIFPS